MDNLAELEERIARLERAAHAAAPDPAPRPAHFPFDLGDDADANVVTYAGHGRRDGDPVAWQVKRAWEDVLAAADGGDGLAAALSALASGPRLRIVAALARGPIATGDLAERVGQSGTGQLFHHLKELLAAGIVHQPQRGVYAIRPAQLVPVLAIVSAAMDVAPHVDTLKEPS